MQPKTQFDFREDPKSSSEYYETIAKEIYSLSRTEGWTYEKTREMLSDPKNFESFLRRVSPLLLTRAAQLLRAECALELKV